MYWAKMKGNVKNTKRKFTSGIYQKIRILYTYKCDSKNKHYINRICFTCRFALTEKFRFIFINEKQIQFNLFILNSRFQFRFVQLTMNPWYSCYLTGVGVGSDGVGMLTYINNGRKSIFRFEGSRGNRWFIQLGILA